MRRMTVSPSAMVFGLCLACLSVGCGDTERSPAPDTARDPTKAALLDASEAYSALLEKLTEMPPQPDTVRIPNMSKLPPKRLADALAVKALFEGNTKLLRKAAALAPDDPRYWRMMAPPWSYSAGTFELDARSRTFLEASLAIDPDYLPALYPYVMSKPTHALRIEGLRHAAKIDKGNAKPYYLMAVETHVSIGEGRLIDPKSDGLGYPMTQGEWNAVLALIRQGNRQETFRAAIVRYPSMRDVEFVQDGIALNKQCADVYARVLEWANEGNGDIWHAPLGFVFSARARGLARQALWEAKKAFDSGDVKGALQSLGVIREFAAKYASSRPYRVTPFLAASGVRRILAFREAQIFEDTGNEGQTAALEAENTAWNGALIRIKQFLEGQLKNPQLAADTSAEEAVIRDIAVDLGLISPQTRLPARH